MKIKEKYNKEKGITLITLVIIIVTIIIVGILAVGVVRIITNNMGEQNDIKTSNKKNESSKQDEKYMDMIGKYVEYTPITGKYEKTGLDTYSGSTQNEELVTDLDAKWRIFKLDDNKLTLISEKSVKNYIYLYGSNGYNNAVLLLNTICNKLYSNNSLGAVARSINIEDIEAVSSFDKTKYKSR